MLALSVLPILMMMVFENPGPFALKIGTTPWGYGMVQNRYAMNVITTLFIDPKTFFDAMFGLGGFSLLRHPQSTPVIIKIVICWTLPILFGAVWAIIDRRSKRRVQ
jgi:hypothetical protein